MSRAFSKQGRRVINILVGHLALLPDALSVSNVRLRNVHPVNRGGFAIIYRGYYQQTDDTELDVALKVIPIFEHHSEEDRRRVFDKFSKEALVWRYLKHPNVVPFLGIDSTTFENQQRALVSPWMVQGSVLDFVAKNSPAAPYALELFHDIIEGLRYLHSENVIHGDLCGRNILINRDERACLSDFGLAAFVEAETSVKTSSRSGSRQWMSPELLNPPPGGHFKRTIASDVWAFACVCCEIWTEGTVPYSHLGKGDPGLHFALGNAMQNPYKDKPQDKAGNEMPEQLWEFCQWCWSFEPSQRPAVQMIVDVLSGMLPREMDVNIGSAPTGVEVPNGSPADANVIT
ncbi:kinase-like domain-containing protein [Roridomyces roridus]|uniref:Kinase-like domain-containing protein n=1 Tax=Roridomyces roridus TaxID=1738132 RepID=A0AAD7CKN5_9AGAR|nr:kinase-like domain-containing protein [Roridomyces roridus]